MNSPHSNFTGRRTGARRSRWLQSRRPQVQRSGGFISGLEALEPRRLLSASTAGKSHTDYVLLSAAGLKPLASVGPVGLTPAQIQHAYGIDQISFQNSLKGVNEAGSGAGETIAIIDAYHDPTIQLDLKAFDLTFGLPDPPSFRQVAQDGSTNYPVTDPAGSPGAGDDTWEIETALDVEWAHAVAPEANILLVEANSTSDANLIQAAVNYARSQPGVVAVSMSFSGGEFSNESAFDTYFTTPAGHEGVTFLAATGDDGKPSGYPAFSPNVVAVGGTTLTTDAAGDYLGETGWSGSGGSVSVYEPQPNYQSGIVTQSATKRANPDVAFDASPNSGVAIYDSYDFGVATPWIQVGGTSLATPAWAGLIAIADQGRAAVGLGSLDGGTQTLPLLYQLPSSDFHDITSGNNGNAAGAGYDLVTGLGTPVANLAVPGLLGASISGTVFNDANSNGVQDNGEGGAVGVTVFDDLNDNGVLDPAVQSSFSSSDIPITIPDRRTIDSTLTVSGFSGNIGDVNVTLNINHTYDSDLVITLISPTGTQVTLASHDGGSGDNFTGTIFDDQALTPISSGLAPFIGSYIPVGSLAALNGTNPNGTWTLQVADTVRLDSGVLNSWSLQITNQPDFIATTDANGNYEFVNVAPGVHHIRELVPANATETVPASGAYDVTINPGDNLTGLNFGNGPMPAVVQPPVIGDFNRDGQRDAADIPALMLALIDPDNYLARYQVTPAQLSTFDDVNQDGVFSNADLQALIVQLNNFAAAFNSASSATTNGVGQAATGFSVSSSAMTSEGYTNPRPTTKPATKAAAQTNPSFSQLTELLIDDLHDKAVANRSQLLRDVTHSSSLSAVDKFFAEWFA